MQEGFFASRKEWVWVAGFLVAAGAGATVLWHLGYGAFEGVPITIPGYLISFLLAYLLTRMYGRRWRTVLLLTVAWVLSLLLYFAVPYEWLYEDPAFFSDSDETAIYWLIQGILWRIKLFDNVG